MDTEELLRNDLFADDGENAYAIVDGAACDELLQHLDEHQPEYCCLYAGELEPDVEACAPHLVALSPEHPFTQWLLSELPGKPWGILLRSTAKLRQLRKHFRGFLMVKNEKGENLYFRYYDPRVIRVFLPTCDDEQFRQFFGPVSSYVAESEQEGFVSYRYKDKKLLAKRLNSASPSGARLS